MSTCTVVRSWHHGPSNQHQHLSHLFSLFLGGSGSRTSNSLFCQRVDWLTPAALFLLPGTSSSSYSSWKSVAKISFSFCGKLVYQQSRPRVSQQLSLCTSTCTCTSVLILSFAFFYAHSQQAAHQNPWWTLLTTSTYYSMLDNARTIVQRSRKRLRSDTFYL